MNTDFSKKAIIYDRFRWDYPEAAINIILKECNINKDSIIADFGAGTGILTKHFCNNSKKIYAIEPDINMMKILKNKKLVNTVCIEKYAHEVEEISDQEIDTIINGHSLHWFDYDKTIKVFHKILKQNGLLVNINNAYANENEILCDINKHLEKYIKANVEQNRNINTDIYFKKDSINTWEVSFIQTQTYESMLNALSSASYYPDASDKVEYKTFKKEFQKIFAKYMLNNEISLNCICTIQIGKLNIT